MARRRYRDLQYKHCAESPTTPYLCYRSDTLYTMLKLLRVSIVVLFRALGVVCWASISLDWMGSLAHLILSAMSPHVRGRRFHLAVRPR